MEVTSSGCSSETEPDGSNSENPLHNVPKPTVAMAPDSTGLQEEDETVDTEATNIEAAADSSFMEPLGGFEKRNKTNQCKPEAVELMASPDETLQNGEDRMHDKVSKIETKEPEALNQIPIVDSTCSTITKPSKPRRKSTTPKKLKLSNVEISDKIEKKRGRPKKTIKPRGVKGKKLKQATLDEVKDTDRNIEEDSKEREQGQALLETEMSEAN